MQTDRHVLILNTVRFHSKRLVSFFVKWRHASANIICNILARGMWEGFLDYDPHTNKTNAATHKQNRKQIGICDVIFIFVNFSKDSRLSIPAAEIHFVGHCLSYGPCQANLVLIAYASSESRGTFRQKERSLAPLNGWACAVKFCHDGMLEDTNLLDGAHILFQLHCEFDSLNNITTKEITVMYDIHV